MSGNELLICYPRSLKIYYKEFRDFMLKSILRHPVKPWMRHKEINIIVEILKRKSRSIA